MFQHLVNLKRLLIVNSNLKELFQGYFYGLNSLVHLDLRENFPWIVSLYSMPFDYLENLKSLNLGKCFILLKKELFKNLKKLHTLWLRPCLRIEDEEELFQSLNNLKELHIDLIDYRCEEEMISITFKHLSELEMLEINLNDRLISKENLLCLKKLKHLSLMNDRKHGEHEDNSAKKIGKKRIKSIFSGFTNLVCLKLVNYRISEISSGFFEVLAQLEELDISNNFIESIKENAFQELNKLKVLIIDSNPLKEIKQDTFAGLNSLIVLKARLYRVNHIEKKAFKCLSNLEEIYLAADSIEFLDESSFSDLAKLRLVGFEQANGQIIRKTFFFNENATVRINFEQSKVEMS
jgi:Leucine-rich repeat (LRR) protein